MQARKEAESAARLVRDALATPKVLVVASDCAAALCEKNDGLRLSQLLGPFGRIAQKATVELEKSTRSIGGMCCEFVDETRYDQEKVQTRLDAVVGGFKDAEQPYGGVPLRSREDVPLLLSGGKDLTPWFTEFSVQLGHSIGSVEHENFGQPVACVVAIASTAQDAVLKMKATFETIRQNIKNLFPDGLAPASLQAQFVLLHDDHEGPMQGALDKLRELQSTFGGQHCHLLRINSLDLMEQHKASGLKTHLSESDLKGVQDFCKHVILALVVPKLVDTLQTSSKQLDAKKKTFSDTLATWWGGGKKGGPQEDAVLPPGGLKYAPSSVVMLYRKVADSAFVLQYYDLAYSAYRACAKEVKKNQDEWLAGCVEMATICSFLTSSAPRDFFEDMEKASKFYSASPGMGRFALRCSIFAAALCKGSNNYLRAGAFYADYAEGAKAPLVAALLQEQASLCLLYLETPRYRRLSFRLVFAARKFVLANQYLHALRCYRYAQGVYADRQWRVIDDHIRYSLGRQLATHGRPEEALDLYQLLLCDSVAAKERQATYLREMMLLAQKVDPPRRSQFPGFHSLLMPVVEQSSARLIVGAGKGLQQPSSIVDELSWAVLEKELQHFGTKMHRRSISVVSKVNRANDCAVEEPCFVEVTLSNSLLVPLQLSQVSVSAFHEPLLGQEPVLIGDTYLCDSFEVFLKPGESATVTFKVIPLVPGSLRVRGLRASMFGQLNIVLPLDVPMVRMRGGKTVLSKALDLNVSGPMPLLECEFLDDAPQTLLAGEMRQCRLRLTNSGKTEMKNVRVKCSHPAFVQFAMESGQEWPTPSKGSGQVEFDRDLRDMSVWEVPIESIGPGGASVDVFVWLRAAEQGAHVLKLLFYYEPISGGGHRWCRFAAPLRVFPLLGVTTQAWPFPDAVDSYLVGVTVRNVSDTLRPMSVSVDQISCGSFQWQPVAIEGMTLESNLLGAGMAIQLAFRVSPHPTPAEISMHFDVALIRENVEALDVTPAGGPVFGFLERENSERILAGASEDSIVSGHTFLPSTLQLAVLWTVDDHCGMQAALDVSVFSDGHHSHHLRKAQQVLVTPGIPSAPPSMRFELQLPDQIEHDFTANGLCFAQGSIVIHNPFPRTIECQLQAHSPSAGSLHTRMCYFFVGKTLHKITLDPLSSVELPLSVGFANAGTFLVDRYQLLVGDQVYFPEHGTKIVVENQ